MASTSLPFPFSSLAFSPLCFFTQQFPWLMLLVSSICAYAVLSGCHLLSCLLTFSALILATISFVRPSSQVKLQETLVKKQAHVCEDTKCNLSCGSDLDPTRESSDGSVSDEESLIEIELPNSYQIEEEMNECWFQRQNLMELLAEISEFVEEDNMIEIDLSMGSIRCPGFEIEA